MYNFIRIFFNSKYFKSVNYINNVLNFLIDLRSVAADAFLAEAFACKPCQIRVKQITSTDIRRIVNKIKQNSKNFVKNEDVYKPIDAVFKPPVPIPVEEVEVVDMGHDGKFC